MNTVRQKDTTRWAKEKDVVKDTVKGVVKGRVAVAFSTYDAGRVRSIVQ